ncbi:ATP-binding cassette domain-containing protein [Rubrimonas cliftonensis]|uniref:ABC-type polysaccharide/polyol phosphate transport system, ATPase component n=1 Tax=Rubrimonas cliftonensis TaxID=89524 RepID=A0A1H4CYK4_9RHOB|nr:ATP-binding cassette domain-containing protein [Rubrimonas cliftonensis]SEA65378.1 ABC-type polysaccharide/polyol phosphate transport system, ATPase component [Rubrimonas cliftonensis]
MTAAGTEPGAAPGAAEEPQDGRRDGREDMPQEGRAVVLALEGVVKRAGRRTVLSGVDARFATGELTAIRGKRGSGKSSLARLLAGVSFADAGRIRRAGLAAPIVGSGAGFLGGAPALRGLELRAAAYGLELAGYTAATAGFLEDAEALSRDFGRIVGRDRTALLYASAYLVPAPVYVVDGAPLPADAALRKALRPLLQAARGRAAVIWIADEKASVSAYRPERALRLENGVLRDDPEALAESAAARKDEAAPAPA